MNEPVSQPLVSVIMPCYNYAAFLAETLNGLRAQTWPHWECLVVDDGSSDHTREVVAACALNDPRFKYLHQQHAGPSAARNQGLRQAQGQFVQFLDADDDLAHRKFENQLAIFQSTPAVDIVFSRVEFFGVADARKKKVYSTGLLTESKTARECLKLLVHQNIMVINVPLIRKTLIDKVGLFDESLMTVEDWNYWIRCALAGAHFQFDSDETSLAKVRLHPQSHSTNQQRMILDSIQVRQQLASDLARALPWPERDALLQFNQAAIHTLLKRLDALKNAPRNPSRAMGIRQMLSWLRKLLWRTG
ncbi:MAG: glycosyltransferase [Kiritimatiellaeota bacterium]|nr:glycosyltransferase [Kiritimatiellota bacterium]